MKYTPGLLAGQLSGKAGNTVASRNRNGSYFRTRTIPKLVRNPLTTAVRASFTALAQGFRSLSAFEQQAWNDLAAQIKRKNSVGESYSLTGLQAYVGNNQNLDQFGLPEITAAPNFSSGPQLASFSLVVNHDVAGTVTTATVGATSATQEVGSTANVIPGDLFHDTTASFTAVVDHVVDGTHVVLTTVVTTVTADAVHFIRPVQLEVTAVLEPGDTSSAAGIYFTAPLSAGVNRPTKSAFRLTSINTGGFAMATDVTAEYIARFGAIPLGSKIFANFLAVNVDGFKGSPATAMVVA